MGHLNFRASSGGLDGSMRTAYFRIHEGCRHHRARSTADARADRGAGPPRGTVPLPASRAPDRDGHGGRRRRPTCRGSSSSPSAASRPIRFGLTFRRSSACAGRLPQCTKAAVHLHRRPLGRSWSASSLIRTPWFGISLTRGVSRGVRDALSPQPTRHAGCATYLRYRWSRSGCFTSADGYGSVPPRYWKCSRVTPVTRSWRSTCSRRSSSAPSRPCAILSIA